MEDKPKVISEYAYNIMRICKLNGCDRIKNLQEYIKEIYWNSSYLTYPELYSNLLGVVLEICSEHEIKCILQYDIPERFRNKVYESGKFDSLPIDYEDLCKVLITKLTFIRVKENDEYLFSVKTKNSIMTIDDYENSSNNEVVIRKRLKYNE